MKRLTMGIAALALVSISLTTDAVGQNSWGTLKSALSNPAPAGKLAVSARVAGIRDRGGFKATVMTRNIYLGAPIGPLLTAPSLEAVPGLVAEMWATMLATDFTERAGALADEIAAANPHLVGLQEVALYRVQSPGDFFVGNPAPATEVEFDFLALLLDELSSRGLAYSAAAITIGSDVELPSATGDDIRLTDREVILVRDDVATSNPQTANFAVNVTLPIGGATGPPVTLLRGWASVDATLFGQTVRFMSTHLETAGVEPVQMAQAGELLQLIGAAAVPVILVGDFNSAADGSTTATYATLTGGGLVDTWNQANHSADGFTCCHADDLLNTVPEFNRRIDLIFVTDEPGDAILPTVNAEVIGDDQQGRTASGLWPSDHAGVVATLRLRPDRSAVAAMPHGNLTVSTP